MKCWNLTRNTEVTAVFSVENYVKLNWLYNYIIIIFYCTYSGLGILFEEARKVTLDLRNKEECLTSLDLSLSDDDIVKNASVAHVKKLQEQMEMTYLAIKHKECNVTKATSK